MRGFLVQLNYIYQFISHLTDKCDPIFKLLKKHDSDEWGENFQKVFDKVKENLFSQPILVPLIPGRPLIFYLAIHEKLIRVKYA